MPDNQALQMMFQNGMNGSAALQMGGNNALGQQMDQAKLREMQMANDQTSVMNPLNAQFKQGQINEQQAQLPGLGGISQSQVAKGNYDTATNSSGIASAIAKNGTSIGEAGLQQMKQDAEKLGQVAGVLKGFDPSMHAQLLPKILQQYGLNPNTPIVQQLMQAPDPSMIEPALTKISDGMAKGTQAYMANTGQQEQAQSFKKAELERTLGSHETIATGNNATSIEVARIQAESRNKVASTKAQAMAQSMGIDKAIAHLEMLGPAQTDEDKETLQRLQSYKLTEAGVRGNAVAPTVLGQDTPIQAAQKAVPAKRGSPSESPASPAAGLSDEAQFADLAKKNGQVYEPAKYEYKVVNGVLHRRPK